jgi:hypothetical protein
MMTGDQAFSLCEGGRLHASLVNAGLSGGARGRLRLVGALLVVGWLPLLLITAAAGSLLGGVDHPLLKDVGAWARCLVVIPIMVFAEPAADRVLGVVIDLFRRTGLVREADRPAFEAAAGQATRMATHDGVELAILLLAAALPHLLVASLPRLTTGAAWFGTITGGELQISTAGRWYAWVSLPLVQFLLFRWLWRILAWWILLWRISRLDLAWAAAHPDGAGGLGFLAWSPRAFRSVFLGISTLAAATISNQVQYGGAALPHFRGAIIAFMVCEILLLLAPQLFFAGGLIGARFAALAKYGLAGFGMTREFDRRWMAPAAPRGAELLDSPQPSAMIDYASTYGTVRAMRPIAITLREVVGILLPVAAPFAPLLLYQYSLADILHAALQLVR